MLCMFVHPPLSSKEMHMTKAASIVVVSLFVSGLCIAPFAMAAHDSAKQDEDVQRRSHCQRIG